MHFKDKNHFQKVAQLQRLASFIVTTMFLIVGAFLWVFPWIWIGGWLGVSQDLILVFLFIPIPQLFVVIVLWPLLGIPYWIKTGEPTRHWIFEVHDCLLDWIEQKLIDKYGDVK